MNYATHLSCCCSKLCWWNQLSVSPRSWLMCTSSRLWTRFPDWRSQLDFGTEPEPPNRWAKMPLHFLGTLVDWGVCVFLNCLRVFSFGRNIFWQVVRLSLFLLVVSRPDFFWGRFGLQQDPTAADWLSLPACELRVSLEFGYRRCRRSSHRGTNNHRSALGSTGFRCLKWVGPILSQRLEDWEETLLLVIHGLFVVNKTSYWYYTIYISPAAQNIPSANMGMLSSRNKGSCLYIYVE